MEFLWVPAILLLVKCNAIKINSVSLTTVAQTNISHCKNLTCANNSTCKVDSFIWEYCLCKRGYQGNTCIDDTDECKLGAPCAHRGNCVNTYGSYRCVCFDGWSGADEHCEIKDNSTSNRVCEQGYFGKWCQDQCFNDSMCLQNQICFEKPVSGWQGTNCTDDKDECGSHSTRCPKNSLCLNTPGSYRCTCLPGWKGDNCTKDIDECSKCDVEINECQGYPCLNSGSCVNTNGSFYCICTSGWNGTECDNDIDECNEDPCNGTLTCTNNLGSYTCSRDQLSNTGDNDNRKTYIIVGSVLGSFLLLLSIIVLVWLWIWKKKKRNATGVDTSNANEKQPGDP